MVENSERIRGKSVVAVVEFHETAIYPTDASAGEWPSHIVAADPHGRFLKVHHHAGNPRGIYEADNAEYWRAITTALAPAGAILLVSHGKGHANAAAHWISYVEAHRKDIAAKVVANVRADIDHMDDEQVLRLAQAHFDAAPPRDFGDGRWGEPTPAS